MFGDVLHGTSGMKIDATNAIAEMIPAYINFFLNIMFSYRF